MLAITALMPRLMTIFNSRATKINDRTVQQEVNSLTTPSNCDPLLSAGSNDENGELIETILASLGNKTDTVEGPADKDDDNEYGRRPLSVDQMSMATVLARHLAKGNSDRQLQSLCHYFHTGEGKETEVHLAAHHRLGPLARESCKALCKIWELYPTTRLAVEWQLGDLAMRLHTWASVRFSELEEGTSLTS